MIRAPRITCFLLIGLALAWILAAEDRVTVPAVTLVYGQLDEGVPTGLDQTAVGRVVPAHVWRDVVVGDRTVIREGAPMEVRISAIPRTKKSAKRGGVLLEAVSVRAVDGSEVPLAGGYDLVRQGAGTGADGVAKAVKPLLVRDQRTALAAGVIFDAAVRSSRDVRLEAAQPGPAAEAASSPVPALAIDLFYEQMIRKAYGSIFRDRRLLPLRITCCGGELADASVVAVNREPISPVALALGPVREDGGCQTATGSLDLDLLGKHFRRGINSIEIEGAGARLETVMDMEL